MNVENLIQNKEYETALTVLKNKAASGADDASVEIQMGDLNMRLHDTVAASECYRRAREQDPDNADALAGSISCSLLEGNPALAEKMISVIRDVRTVNACLARAEYQRYHNRIDLALQELEAGYGQFPQSDVILLNLIKIALLNNMRDPRIGKWFDEYRTKFSEDPEMLMVQLTYFYQNGMKDPGLKLCKRILQRYPNEDVAVTARTFARKMKSSDFGSTKPPVERKNNSEKQKQKENPKVPRKAHINGEEESEPTSENVMNAEEAKRQLDSLIGLTEVKKEIYAIKARLDYEKKRNEYMGFHSQKTDESYHFVFMGNPGTGKTTVARLLGAIFHSYGILKKGQLIECSRADLVGQFQGSTAIKTNKIIKEALGGVLFIDEAYALYSGPNDNFGLEAIDALVKGMEDHRSEFMVILAGYEREMQYFMRANSGLESRFRRVIHFPDYTDEELLKIAESEAVEQQYHFTEDGKMAFLQMINKKKVDAKFGNARAVRNLMSDAIEEKALHFDPERDGKEYFTTLQPKDFGIDIMQTPEERVQEGLRELHSLTGLKSVKRDVEGLLSVVNYQIHSRKPGERFSQGLPRNMNMFFLGSPGTGKTTVARIYAKILAAMGILKKGQLVEVSRGDLVGQWQGHTAQRTREKCEEAYGGVLFIDEAYSLYRAGTLDSFGQEAIATLIKEMEDNRDKMVVIMAGYTKEMQEFEQANSGIASRIGKTIVFPDYNENELQQILINMLKKGGFTAYNLDAQNQLQQTIATIYKNRSENFGNARTIRNLYEAIYQNLATRVEKNKITGEARRQYTAEDILLAEKTISY